MARAPLLALVVCLLLLCPEVLAQESDWRTDFSEGMESPNSWERREAILTVDAEEKDGLAVLLDLLGDEQVDWYLRRAVSERLASVTSRKGLKGLKRGLKGRNPRVREGVVISFGIRGNRAYLPDLLRSARDRSPVVRRAAVAALAAFPREVHAVGGILQLWEREPKGVSRVGVECYGALRRVTRWDEGLSPTRWRTYWDQVKLDWPPGGAKDPGEGLKRTRVRGVRLTFLARGKGTPLLVIPDYTLDASFYQPWFRAIEDIYRVTYVQVPRIPDFDRARLKYYRPGLPYYPVDLLVEALDQLRADRGEEKVALLAHGYNTLIALRYLSRFPDRLSHVILIGPATGYKAWRKALDGIRRTGRQRGDVELSRMARSLIVTPSGRRHYTPSGDLEWFALRRKLFSLYFADPSDPAVFPLYSDSFLDLDPEVEGMTPAIELSGQKRAPVPILVQMGERCLWTTRGDAGRLEGHYPQVSVHYYPKSALCPFVEETTAWSRDVHAFHDRHAGDQR